MAVHLGGRREERIRAAMWPESASLLLEFLVEFGRFVDHQPGALGQQPFPIRTVLPDLVRRLTGPFLDQLIFGVIDQAMKQYLVDLSCSPPERLGVLIPGYRLRLPTGKRVNLADQHEWHSSFNLPAEYKGRCLFCQSQTGQQRYAIRAGELDGYRARYQAGAFQVTFNTFPNGPIAPSDLPLKVTRTFPALPDHSITDFSPLQDRLSPGVRMPLNTTFPSAST